MQIFTQEDTWKGGFYELAIELGPRSNARLEAALAALWQNPRLRGCYALRGLEPTNQLRLEPSLTLLERYGHLLGVTTLPNAMLAACGVVAVRENTGTDWLDFYIPMGALTMAYDVGAFPFDDGKNSQVWREPLDNWLVTLAHDVFTAVPFALALVGHEVSGQTCAAEITTLGIAAERWEGYLWQEAGTLLWYPPTIYKSP